MRYLNATEAAAKLTHITGTPWSAEGVRVEARAERLPVCFGFNGVLTIFSIDGETEGIPPRTIAFDGFVRASLPPSDDGLHYPLLPVELVEAFGIHSTHRNGALVQGAELPTESPHGGQIKTGHQVQCFAEDCYIPTAGLRFCIDDLKALSTSGTTAPATAAEMGARHWQTCLDAGLKMPSDTFAQYPRGIGKIAQREGIERQTFAKRMNAYREKKFSK